MQSVASPAAKDMVSLPGATFAMGSAEFYAEEGPVHEQAVGPFAIDRHPVTVAQFRRFVADTGHVTEAERELDPARYPDADPQLLVPGSLVFQPTAGPVSLRDVRAWWSYVPGACWHAPEGPGSTVRGRHRHPVTHVAHEDALAYARWARKALPTEAEWEYAARGGLDGARFSWGDELAPGGRMMANWWQGRFPWENLLRDGYERTSPVAAFPPNGFGLFDVCGNTWEWTQDLWGAHGEAEADDSGGDGEAGCGCAPGATAPQEIPRRVIKGGSHLCAPSYCLRYRPAARQGEAVDTSTSHLGFRCVVRPQPGSCHG